MTLNPDQFGPKHIEIPADAVAEMLAASSAGRMAGEMAEHAQRTPVNLSDPIALKSHLMEAHEWEDSDLWRNSQPSSVDRIVAPSLDDFEMSHNTLRRVHDEHDHEVYKHDWPGAITHEDEHFHG